MSASTPPADAPTTMMSCPSSVGSFRRLSLARPTGEYGYGSMVSILFPVGSGISLLISGRPMDLMNDDETAMDEFGRSVIKFAAETRAMRAELVAQARAQRRRGRRLRDQALSVRERNLDLSWRLWSLKVLPEPPSTIPLSWGMPRDAGEQRDAAFDSAEECANACIAALRFVD